MNILDIVIIEIRVQIQEAKKDDIQANIIDIMTQTMIIITIKNVHLHGLILRVLC
jgi:hypothetical protein